MAKTTFEAIKELNKPEDLAKVILHFQKNARTLQWHTYNDLLYSCTEWLKGEHIDLMNKIISMSDDQLVKNCEDTDVEKSPDE